MKFFEQVSSANLLAYASHPRQEEIVQKKKEILKQITDHHSFEPSSILFIGFSAFVMTGNIEKLYITCIDDDVKEFLSNSGIDYIYISEHVLNQYNKKFDMVIAVDEFFTFASSDDDQRALISNVCKLSSGVVLTTLRDYKNLDFKEREFSKPVLNKKSGSNVVLLETHDWSSNDRIAWKSFVHCMENESSKYFGTFSRRTMYFKQLAKFSIDACAKSFYVHKNIMYKGLYKKNFEHIITIQM